MSRSNCLNRTDSFHNAQLFLHYDFLLPSTLNTTIPGHFRNPLTFSIFPIITYGYCNVSIFSDDMLYYFLFERQSAQLCANCGSAVCAGCAARYTAWLRLRKSTRPISIYYVMFDTLYKLGTLPVRPQISYFVNQSVFLLSTLFLSLSSLSSSPTLLTILR